MCAANTKVWFITGASSGFGKAMVELTLEPGEIVVAAARRIHLLGDLVEKYSPGQLLVVRCDCQTGRINIVYNNAGQSVVGEVESVPEETARAVMEVNFWGVVNVSKEAVRFFPEENPKGSGGTLLQMSSILAVTACPIASYYAASRREVNLALEGFSESILAELQPEWNIKVVILEPGWHATNILGETLRTPVHPAYQDPTSIASLTRASVDGKYDDPETQDVHKATLAIYKFMQQDEMPLRFPLGKDTLRAMQRRGDELKRTAEICEKFSDDLSRDRLVPV
ncbi:NAD(P)-binding protein [Gyrodon lividus]|nr:NAD(P)-binding protein [Gyrodon lividus]